MNQVKVLVDSCADLTGELLEKYGIDYVHMCTVYQGTESPASLLWETVSPKEFYDIMRRGERITTTQVPAAEFDRVFRSYLEKGYDILYIACSHAQSGSYNTSEVIAKGLRKEYPDRRIVCIDSLNSSMGEGLLAVYASQQLKSGKDLEEVAAEVTAKRNLVNQYVTVPSLDCLHRAGRVKGAKAFFGNLMGVKPILISDANGVQTPIKKAKGRMGSLTELVAMMKEAILDPEDQDIYLAHADCSPDEVEMLKKMVRDAIPCRDVIVGYIGPIVGASVGPGTIGIWAFGKEVTYCVEEGK